MHLAQTFLPVSFFRWCEGLTLSDVIKNSQWDFAIIETLHIIGIAVLLGATLVIDLRLLGLGMRRQTIQQVAAELTPWTWGALAFMFLTGIPMFLSEAVRMGFNTGFFYKMIFLAIAIVIHLTIHRKALRPGTREGSAFAKVAACVSILSWLSVALAGRAIAFLQVLNG